MAETIGFNMAVKNFEVGIIDKINGNGLPASVTLLVLEKITKEFEKEVDRVTSKEVEEYNTRKEKEYGQADNSDPMGKQAVGEDGTGRDQTE
ncbi:MAG: hypothetical protein K2J35_02460 [Eubacterium sp.]|nr:hypothetical protein [Eubacterium sp.]